MWRLSAAMLILATGLAAVPPIQDPSAFEQPGAGSMFDHNDASPAVDSNSLSDKVDEAVPLYDALARETRRLDKGAKDSLYQALRTDYDLGGQVGVSRKLLEASEGVLDLQDAVRGQEDLVKRLGPDAPEGDIQAKKLQDLELGLSAAKDDLRRTLTGQQKDLNEKDAQQLREWLMVSEGQLRHRREDAEAAAAAHPLPAAPPLDASGLSPVASSASPTAGVKP